MAASLTDSTRDQPQRPTSCRRFVLGVILVVAMLVMGIIVALFVVRSQLVALKRRIDRIAHEFLLDVEVRWGESTSFQQFWQNVSHKVPPEFLTDCFQDINHIYVRDLKEGLPPQLFEDLNRFDNVSTLHWLDTRNSVEVAKLARQQRDLNDFSFVTKGLRDRDLDHAPLFARLHTLAIDGLQSRDLTGQFLQAAVGHAPYLDQLWLHHMNLTANACEALGQLTTIEYLDLTGCRLTSEWAQPLASLTKLKNLNLDDTQVDDQLAATFAAWKVLEVLNVKRTLLTARGLGGLQHCPQLKRLETGGKRGTPGLLAQLRKCVKLRTTDIVWTGDFSRDELAQFKDLADLTYLYFADFSDANARHLTQCTHLTGLDIHSNRLTLQGVHELMQLPDLHHLKLSGSTWGPELVEILDESLSLETVKVLGRTWKTEEFEDLRAKLADPAQALEPRL